MFPTLYEVQTAHGAAGVHTYGLLVLAAFVAGVMLVHVRARAVGLPVERLPVAYLVAALGGFLGAKVLYAVAVGDPGALLSISGGYAYYGGLLGGGLAVAAAAGALRIEPWKLADVTAPGLVLGAGIGRLGCFFAGCCHGAPVPAPEPATGLLPQGLLHGDVLLHPHAPWVSLRFDDGVGALLGVPLYPTQLWQSVGSFALVAVLLAIGRFKRFDGQVVGVWLLLEPALRFVVESFRADERGLVLSWPAAAVPGWLPLAGEGGELVGVTTSQALGVLMMALGVAILVLRRGRGVTPERPVDEPWVDDLLDDAT